ncbi:histone deacetylase 11-like [Oppia nitens]|uniref:histone deacetylase 11-like n=1 Tax=Oppia nitens TaxID=1686743 RepID=UPI0023D9E48A|nr:histone deacetylase 11-like [Oppia nitens]
MKWQTSGSILAAQLAIEHGWAINLGGGFHHASQLKAEGFCLLADISLIIKYLWKYRNPDLKFMIIDLDAHQGNGYAIDKSILLSKERDQIYIFDLYNKDIFPNNAFAKLAINEHIEISSDIQDDEYITLLKKNLACAFNEYKPDLIIYNAGTDVLNGDPLGNMNLTITGVIDRDQIVFEHAKTNNIPIVMLTR